MKKEEDITLRIDSDLKEDFKKICDREKDNMSNKIHEFIKKEVDEKKRHTAEFQAEEMLKLLGYGNITVIEKPCVNISFENGMVLDDSCSKHFMMVSDFNLSEKSTCFIDFIESHKHEQIYLFLAGCSFPNKIRAFTFTSKNK